MSNADAKEELQEQLLNNAFAGAEAVFLDNSDPDIDKIIILIERLFHSLTPEKQKKLLQQFPQAAVFLTSRKEKIAAGAQAIRDKYPWLQKPSKSETIQELPTIQEIPSNYIVL